MNPKPNPHISEPDAGYAEAVVRPLKPAVAPLTAQQQVYLREVLEDLADLDEYAAEKDVPPPAPVALEAARTFLHQAVLEAPRRYAVCPWTEGAMVVFTQGAKGYRVDISFDADGGASCLILHPRSKETDIHRYSPAAKVANKWVFDALRQMKD